MVDAVDIPVVLCGLVVHGLCVNLSAHIVDITVLVTGRLDNLRGHEKRDVFLIRVDFDFIIFILRFSNGY
mgnify:CR=1 FL=1